MPSAHWRTEGRARFSAIGGVVAQEQSSAHQAAERIAGRTGCGQCALRSSASASLTLCARPERARKRCLRFSSAAWPAIAQPSCARQPSSNGRSRRFVWESGWSNERNHDTRAGCGAGQAGRGHCGAAGKARWRRMDHCGERARRMPTDVAAIWRRMRGCRPLSAHFETGAYL